MLRKGLITLAVSAFASLPVTAISAVDLVDYEIVDGYSIPEPLTDQPGDPERGKQIAMDRKLGNCLACHKMPVDAPFHGTVGPDLSAVGSYMTAGQMRLRLVDPKAIYADSVMPAFYKVDGLTRVMPRFQGKPILTAQQIEDIIAYLETLEGE